MFLSFWQQQVMKQQQQQRRGHQQIGPRNRGGNARNGLSPYVWPPTLQHSRHPHQNQWHHNAFGTTPLFLQYPTTKPKCSGTGVFLPRPLGTPSPTLNKPGLSPFSVSNTSHLFILPPFCFYKSFFTVSMLGLGSHVIFSWNFIAIFTFSLCSVILSFWIIIVLFC